ncbi:hydroxymethylbilane synthase [Methanothermus fervidus DSM 2088]|uniref:Probable porphobilinogen deaminase n=1 Tax=Methanothermus fervidus (strain ATCC 43054 / DSM 2088 / JCM 10308 / V24 S) TaxID=523846 RepID=E3GWS3_METFV|nr:hydroxymethylbilane synthase [Methanothermus fervidus]ADP77992.1 hydroxymethylbilane synthase [Methanothermus fervidus DSM 2088]
MIVGTRGSPLALKQTYYVVNQLSKLVNEEVKIKIIKTTGDKIKDSQLHKIGQRGVFTKEIDKAVLNEEVDLAVHSLKDVPTELHEDLEIVAIPHRDSPNEVLVSKYSWDELSEECILGTSSLRRKAFCRYHGKKFKIKPLRGNIETRIKKVEDGEYDATIMAEAALKRLNLEKYIKKRFSVKYFTPSAGQGAIAIETRSDSKYISVLKKLNDHRAFYEVTAERTVLKELGVGCQWPIGVVARSKGKNLNLYAILLSKKGKLLSKIELDGKLHEATKLGKKAAKKMEGYI